MYPYIFLFTSQLILGQKAKNNACLNNFMLHELFIYYLKHMPMFTFVLHIHVFKTSDSLTSLFSTKQTMTPGFQGSVYHVVNSTLQWTLPCCAYMKNQMMRRHATHLLSHLAVTGVLGSAVITDFSVIWPNRQGEGSGEIKKSTETMMGQDLLILERKLKGIYVGNETTVCEGRATPYPHFHREAGVCPSANGYI